MFKNHVKNHAFIDGNKRAGLAALIAFLSLNGHELGCDTPEAQSMTLRAAASEIKEAEWVTWVEETVRPISTEIP